MRAGIVLASAMAVGVIFSLPAISQSSTIAAGQARVTGLASGGVAIPAGSAPYTAEFKTSRVQALVDGTTITTETTTIRAKDSKGRWLESTTNMQPYTGQMRTNWHVRDTAAGTQIDWNSESKEAKLVKMPPPGSNGCWHSELSRTTIQFGSADSPVRSREAATEAQDPSTADLRPKTTTEDLGKMTIQGVQAHGRRLTTTTPAGAIGNDRPLVKTEERWNAILTGITVKSVVDDPRTGKETVEAVSFKLGDPDPGLFLPPESYEMKTDEMVPCTSN
jgi:hypothetical protein